MNNSENKEMLTGEEKKLVQKYARLAAFIRPSYTSAIAVIIVWGIIYCATDIIGQAYSVFGWWLGFALTEIAVLMIGFSYSAIKCRVGYKKDEWKKIAEKVGAEVDDGGIISQYVSATVIQQVNTPAHFAAATATVSAVSNLLYNNAAVVAEASETKIVTQKQVMKRSLLISIALIVAFSIPMALKASADTRHMKETAADAIEKIVEAYTEEGITANSPSAYFGDWTYSSGWTGEIDPKKIRYRNTSYDMSCYTDEDYSEGSYITIEFDNSGVITGVTYRYRIEEGETPQEAYEQLKKDFTACHRALLKTGLPFASDELRDVYLPTEEFRSRFMEADLSAEGASFFTDDGHNISDHLSYSLDRYNVSVTVNKPRG